MPKGRKPWGGITGELPPGHESPCRLGPGPHSGHRGSDQDTKTAGAELGLGGTGGAELCQAAALEPTATGTKRKGRPHIPVHPHPPREDGGGEDTLSPSPESTEGGHWYPEALEA